MSFFFGLLDFLIVILCLWLVWKFIISRIPEIQTLLKKNETKSAIEIASTKLKARRELDKELTKLDEEVTKGEPVTKQKRYAKIKQYSKGADL